MNTTATITRVVALPAHQDFLLWPADLIEFSCGHAIVLEHDDTHKALVGTQRDCTRCAHRIAVLGLAA